MEKFIGTDKNILVIYHGNCRDGITSAYVAYKKFGEDANYIPQIYGKEYVPHNLEGKEIYIVDFTYSKEEMLHMESIAKKLVVIDHHFSAREKVEHIKEHVFSLEHSASYLTWQYFFPQQKVPRLIEYVSDYDTWTNKLPHIKEVAAYLDRYNLNEITFHKLDDMLNEFENEKSFEIVIKTGNILKDVEDKQIDYFKDKAQKITFEGMDVYAVNAPKEIRGDLGFKLANDIKTFAMIFYYEQDVYRCSLRSINGFDVSKIAEKYGGGGNKNQSSFVVPENFELATSLNKI